MKKALAICLTDTHAHQNNIDVQESVWKQVVGHAKKLDIKKIIHLGDFVVDRKSQSLQVLDHLSWVKNYVLDNDMSLIGITGNHDKVALESTSAYPNLYDDVGFKIIEEEHELKLSDNICVWLLPYFPESGSYKERVKSISDRLDESKFNIIGSHIGVSGGLSHKNATINKEVPAGIFKKFNLGIFGHYHNKNLVEHEFDCDLWYIGSTHAANYGEDNDKGFTVIYDDGSIEFINSEFTKFETISIDVNDVDGKWMSETKKYISEGNVNVRVIVTGDESELKKIKKQMFSEIGVKKLKLNTDSVAIRNEDDRVVFVSLDKDTVIKEYKKFSVSQEIDSSLGLEYLV
jgi:exonuclease SbcD